MIVAAVDGTMTWRTHEQEQRDRELLGEIWDGVTTLVKREQEGDPTLTEQAALRQVLSDVERELERMKKPTRRQAHEKGPSEFGFDRDGTQ